MRLGVEIRSRLPSNNPDPTVDVEWGLPTHAEMSQGYMSFRRLQERHIVVGAPIADGSGGGGRE